MRIFQSLKLALALSAAALACLPAAIYPAGAQDFSKGSWIDLTHAFNEDAVYWPTAAPFKKEKVFYGDTEGGWFYSAFNYAAAEHGGTHLDSPIHFARG